MQRGRSDVAHDELIDPSVDDRRDWNTTTRGDSDDGVGIGFGVAQYDALAVAGNAAASMPGGGPAIDVVTDDTHDRCVVVNQCDRRGEAGVLTGEVSRAVDGVDDPAVFVRLIVVWRLGDGCVGGFFADEGVVGVFFGDALLEHFLDATVGFGDRTVVGFVFDGGVAHEFVGDFGGVCGE